MNKDLNDYDAHDYLSAQHHYPSMEVPVYVIARGSKFKVDESVLKEIERSYDSYKDWTKWHHLGSKPIEWQDFLIVELFKKMKEQSHNEFVSVANASLF